MPSHIRFTVNQFDDEENHQQMSVTIYDHDNNDPSVKLRRGSYQLHPDNADNKFIGFDLPDGCVAILHPTGSSLPDEITIGTAS
jgi:hypothetical protein